MNRFQLAFQGSPAECVDAFVAAAQAFRARDPLTPIAALVGSHWLRRELRDRLHVRRGGFWGLRALTFRDLTDRLGAPALLRAGRRPVSPIYQRALATRLLRERPGYFAPVQDYDGAAATFGAMFDDLEDAGWPEWPASAPRDGKLADVAALYNAYRAALTAHFFTPQDALAATANAAADFPAAFGANRLHVVGIYDVNPLQWRLLENLARHIEIEFFAPQPIEPTPLTKKLGIQTPSDCGLRIADCGLPDTQSPVPSPQSRVPTPKSRIPNPESRLPPPAFWSCPSESAEAQAIVRQTLALRREGVAFHEMAVLLRHPETYADLIAETCERAGVPCRVADGRTPHEARSLRALLQAIALIGAPLGRGEVMAFLTAVQPPGDATAPAGPAGRALWERVSRAAMVKKGDDWDRRLADFADDEDPPDNEREAARSLREAAAELRRHLAAIEGAANYGDAAAALAALARRFIDADEQRDEALERLAELPAIDEAGLAFDAAFFRARAAEIVLAVKEDGEASGGLTIIDWAKARGLRFRVVFLPGCVEGMIPQPPRQDPVLLNAERLAVAHAAGRPGALPTSDEQAKEELRLFDFMCGAAAERLFLSFPRTDPASGRPRLPSHLLLALAGRAAGRTLTYDELLRESPLVEVFPAGRFAPASFAAALDDDERDLCAMADLARHDELAPIHYLLAVRPAEFGRVWRRQQNRWAQDRVTVHDGLCESPAATAAIARYADGKRYWSVTEIEDFGRCPRRYLFGRVLKLESPVDPEEVVALPPDARGNVIHDALASLADRPNPDVRAEVERLYRLAAKANLTGGGLLDEIECARLTAWTTTMLAFVNEQSVGRRQLATEYPVSGDIEVEGGRRVPLKGRLDRVDRAADGGTRIVDYKTGKAKSSFQHRFLQNDSFNAGATLQLPLYLLLASAKTAGARGAPQEAAYWYLKNAKGDIDPKAVVFGPDFLPQHEGELRLALAQMIDDLRRGCFAPRPDLAATVGNDYCANCEFVVACDPRGRARLAAKAQNTKLCRWLDVLGFFA
jgi:RecB family exonuclease